jgi:hypothetical protein
MRRRKSFMTFNARQCVLTKMAGLTLGLGLMPVAGQADIYLWQDSQGAPRCSEVRPANGAREVRKLRTVRRFTAGFAPGQFKTSTGDGTSDDGVWWVEQKAGAKRASIVNVGVEGRRALRLHTEPGDSDVSGSGPHERNDVAIAEKTTGCSQGREQWWELSILFPDDYVSPPEGTVRHWYALAGFHHSGPTGQGNFTLYEQPGSGLVFGGFGGETVANDRTHPGFFTAPAGPVRKNVWYEFTYHVKWSSGADGFFDAWMNGEQKLSHRGPTLYKGMGCYLKLANYHTAFGQPTSVLYGSVTGLDVDSRDAR